MKKFICRGTVKFYDSTTNHFGFVTIKASDNPDIIGQDAYLGKEVAGAAYTPADADEVYFTVSLDRKGSKVLSIVKKAKLTISDYERWMELLTLDDSIAFFNLLREKNMLVQHRFKNDLSLKLCEGISLEEQNSDIILELLQHSDDEMIEKIISRWDSASFSIKVILAEKLAEDNHAHKIQDDWNTLSLEQKQKHINLLIESGFDWIAKGTDWPSAFKVDERESSYMLYRNLLDLGIVREEDFSKVNLSEQDILDIPFDTEVVEHYPKILEIALAIWIRDPERYFTTKIRYSEKRSICQERINHFITHKNSAADFEAILGFLIKIIRSIDSFNIKELSKIIREFPKFLSFRLKLSEKLLEYAVSSSVEENIKIKTILEAGGVWNSYLEQLEPLNKLRLYLRDMITIDDPTIFSYLLPELEIDAQCLYFSRISVYYINNQQKDELVALIGEFLSSPKHEMDKYAPSILFISYLINEIGDSNRDLADIKGKANSVFEFVYSRLMSETLISNKLSYFFEPCDGIVYKKQLLSFDEDGKETPIVGKKTSESDIKRSGQQCNFCEGKETTTKDNHEIYWCRNSYCARASRLNYIDGVQDSKVTLSYLFHSFGYESDSVSAVSGFINGWVNKINTFLGHLACRSCDKPLYPHDKGSGYYRCSKFSCRNESCSELMKEIYLTHCLNPDCVSYIDSRDSAQCPHGWYVCDYCYGCCTTEKIENRIKFYESIGKTYKGATKGHKNISQICCPSCGTSFNGKSDSYIRMLDKFQKMAAKKNPRIKSHGAKNGCSWFIIQILNGESLDEFDKGVKKLGTIGFEIGNNYFKGNSTAFIAEPWSSGGNAGTFHCPNSKCDHILSISELEEVQDFGRLRAIKKFHADAIRLLN